MPKTKKTIQTGIREMYMMMIVNDGTHSMGDLHMGESSIAAEM